MRSLTLMLALCAGCGARSGLEPLELPAPIADAGVLPDAVVVSDAGTDAGIDVGPPDAGVCEEPLLVITRRTLDRCPSGHVSLGNRLLLGEANAVMVVDLENRSDRAMRITRWHLGEHHPDDLGCSLRTIRWFGLRNAETHEGLAMAVPERRDRDNNDVTFFPDDLAIPPGTTTIALEVMLANYLDGGCPGWTMDAGFFVDPARTMNDMDVVWADGTPLPGACVCTCNGGIPMYFGTGLLTVRRAMLHVQNRWPSRSVPIGGERQIAEFTVINEPNVGAYAATLEAMTLAVSGISSWPGHTLRLYVDTIDAANLLGSAVIGAGTAPVPVEFRDDDLVDVDVGAGMGRELLVTVDTDGFGTSGTLQVDVRNAQWSDGVGRYGDVDCEPIDGVTVTFAPAP